MPSTAIEIDRLSKMYRIGGRSERHQSMRGAIVGFVKSPLERFRRFRGGTSEKEETLWALKDVSFSVNHGEVLGIIGRNGAGKSTLLKILSRITRPTTGKADIFGRVGSLLEVGTGFHPELTGRENIFLNGCILGMKKKEIERKFDEIVAFSEVERFLETPVKRYSSGMYVRLAFAVAAHMETDILIIDEVLAVGDAAFQKKCLGKMGDVSREGRTVLFVSHNMSLISSLCKRVILIKSGSVEVDDAAHVAIDKYLLSSSHVASADLSTAVDNRMGNREYATLTGISIFDEKKRPADTFSMGQQLTVQVDLQCRRPFPHAQVGLKISSRHGTPIHYFVSTWEGLRIDLSEGSHRFEFTIPQLHLYPGGYFLTPWTASEGNSPDDLVEGAVIMTVVGNDLTGHSPDFDGYARSGCEVYAPSKCSFLY